MIERSQIFADCFFLLLPRLVAAKYFITERKEIFIYKIPANTVRDMHILPSVIIEICKQHAPTPVRSLNTGELPYFTKKRYAGVTCSVTTIIKLKHISHKFRFITHI